MEPRDGTHDSLIPSLFLAHQGETFSSVCSSMTRSPQLRRPFACKNKWRCGNRAIETAMDKVRGQVNKQPFYVHYELAGAGQIDWSVKRERQRRTGQSPFPLRFGYHSQDTRRRTCGSQDQASQDSTRRLLVYSVGGSKNVVCGRWGPRFSLGKGRQAKVLPPPGA